MSTLYTHAHVCTEDQDKKSLSQDRRNKQENTNGANLYDVVVEWTVEQHASVQESGRGVRDRRY